MPTNGTQYNHAVAQASVTVSAQAGCDVQAAIELMTTLAFDTDCTLEEIATMVIDSEVRFDH